MNRIEQHTKLNFWFQIRWNCIDEHSLLLTNMLKFFVFIKSKHSTPDNGSLSLLDKPNQSYKLFWKLKASMQGIDHASNSRVPIIYLVDRQSSFLLTFAFENIIKKISRCLTVVEFCNWIGFYNSFQSSGNAFLTAVCNMHCSNVEKTYQKTYSNSKLKILTHNIHTTLC